MIVLIDNYDSFVYNLYQYLGELGCDIKVFRNDEISIKRIEELKPKGIVLSPGPCYPGEAGICVDLVKELHEKFPILGVCLGHQAICEAFGGTICRAGEIFHGKSSKIFHDASALFKDMENPVEVGRYHSLVLEPASLPEVLDVTSRTENGTVMSVAHKKFPVLGIQFHPESILTPSGKQILKNFLKLL